MSYSKGFGKGYKSGFNAGMAMAMDKLAYTVNLAGAVRKKQLTIVAAELAQQKKDHVQPQPCCQFDRPWQGFCGSPKILDNGQCEAHQEKCSCGKVATQGCSHAGQFVCGRPLCDDCECNH